ncbi:helix-turn-helix domain-containing protein [Mesorhizobium sp. XAP10]|uniref:helix-turn-helix domain-containing protein n=1 Tax=unclassified Mesorhizobium TaxID=325217 RepID=UPI001FDF69FA|nr:MULTISPECIES: helix-turn-helix domain-containing protein [unclassified Mesorhizobium]MDF3154790.1 helix-turn-helix domain-containing protein [Mesorhizobium sp. XAP10]MDF3247660.1 helix-turn-helix domain-containing protein [Mesorhizobium sp. XAP4]
MPNGRNSKTGLGVTSAALTIDETADYLRICRSTVYKLFREGQLKPAKVGGRTLVRRVDADAFLERCVA